MTEQRKWINMSKGTTYISFYNKRGGIRIFKQTMRVLGLPKFIRFQLHQERHLMLLEPYDKISFTSFRVPTNLEDENGKLDIYSKAFTHLISKVMGWDFNRSYRVLGIIDEEKKYVVFNLDQAVEIMEDNSVNTFARLYAEQTRKENLDEYR